MMRTTLCTGLAAGCLLSAVPAEAGCTLSRAEEDVSLDHVYVVRVPDTFDEEERRLRILCLPVALEASELASADATSNAIHRGERGLLVELNADAEPIYTAIGHDGGSSQFSGTIWDVAFEGAEENGRLRGTITTPESLRFDDSKPGWTFTVAVDAAIVETR
jgi:hypothetical protein